MSYKFSKYLFSAAMALIAAVSMLVSCKGGGKQVSAQAQDADSLYFARGLKIAYFNGFTKVTLRDPWDTLKIRKEYILVQKDLLEQRPALKDSLNSIGILIATPVERAVIYTSVHTAMADQLGVLDKVVGICEPEYITSDKVLNLVNNQTIADLGKSTSPNVEKIIGLGTDVIIASPFENSGYGAAEKLGIPIVEAADYMESHPLGRTEWIKFYGLLFGCRARADSLFNETCNNYLSLKELARDVTERPTVILERKWGQTWAVPAGGSYVGCLHRDAGADYVFTDVTGQNSAHKSFEEVFDRGCEADFWLMKYGSSSTMSYDDLKKEYLPYSDFKAFKSHNIFGCNTLVSAYYDDITLHPDQILADLIYIYHPELLPEHRLQYYFPLSE